MSILTKRHVHEPPDRRQGAWEREWGMKCRQSRDKCAARRRAASPSRAYATPRCWCAGVCGATALAGRARFRQVCGTHLCRYGRDQCLTGAGLTMCTLRVQLSRPQGRRRARSWRFARPPPRTFRFNFRSRGTRHRRACKRYGMSLYARRRLGSTHTARTSSPSSRATKSGRSQTGRWTIASQRWEAILKASWA
jgi:hypothetical protein